MARGRTRGGGHIPVLRSSPRGSTAPIHTLALQAPCRWLGNLGLQSWGSKSAPSMPLGGARQGRRPTRQGPPASGRPSAFS
jgi:hypothetical protein